MMPCLTTSPQRMQPPNYGMQSLKLWAKVNLSSFKLFQTMTKILTNTPGFSASAGLTFWVGGCPCLAASLASILHDSNTFSQVVAAPNTCRHLHSTKWQNCPWLEISALFCFQSAAVTPSRWSVRNSTH
jgi:hypothetical protein